MSEARQMTPESPAFTLRLPGSRRLDAQGLWNISLGGLFIETAESVPFGQELDLEVDLGAHRTLRCRGFVIWSTKEAPLKGGGRMGFGVRLCDIGIADMRLLAERVGRGLEAGEERA